VILDRSDAGNITLVVSDDGKGNGRASDRSGRRGVGLVASIIESLVVQLEATISVQNVNGTRSEICVPPPVAQSGGLTKSVLVVDDEILIALGFRFQVEAMGLAVCDIAATADKAVAAARKHRPAVVLMDLRLRGDKDGVDAARAIHETVGSKVIFTAGSREPATIERINSDYPFAVLFKPISDRELESTVADAMSQQGHAL
jgi:CheY-like chemotaxis protein